MDDFNSARIEPTRQGDYVNRFEDECFFQQGVVHGDPFMPLNLEKQINQGNLTLPAKV